MSEIALVTANFGGIDDIKTLPQHDGIDAFYYTDAATRSQADQTAIASWTRVLVPNYPRHDFGSRLRAKYFKLQVHRLDEVRDHRWIVWADGSLQFHETAFLLEQVEKLRGLPEKNRLMVVPHPDRKTVWEEYEFVQTQIIRGNKYLGLRYAEEKMTEQMDYFQARGWDTNAKLWCGTIWLLENNAVLNCCWNDWWDQNLRYGMMDQLSLPVLLNKHGCEPQCLDVNLWRNGHFSSVNHVVQRVDGCHPERRSRTLYSPKRTAERQATMLIDHLYQRVRATPSDIWEHLELLSRLASLCDHVTEFGTREGTSTVALLFGRPKAVVSYDIRPLGLAAVLRSAAAEAGVQFQFCQKDVQTIKIDPTDFLLIDTLHTFDQLTVELSLHAERVRRYIAVHDTTTFGDRGGGGEIDDMETPKKVGLWPALALFLREHQEWQLLFYLTNNNGMTVLERRLSVR
jgi:hypothetical protein